MEPRSILALRISTLRLTDPSNDPYLPMGRALWAPRQQSPKFLVDSSPIAATTDLLAALDHSDEGRQLRTALDDLLTACGHRGNHWGLHYPTWIEDPAPVFAALRAAATDPQISPSPHKSPSASRLSPAVRKRLQSYPQKARALRRIAGIGALRHDAEGRPPFLERLQRHLSRTTRCAGGRAAAAAKSPPASGCKSTGPPAQCG